ncbi:MAG: InlB B-repeat-containing protein [Clostridiales bacterium]|nr:InlB B-repeat-containing protein [Clostridiales bacterium]
MMRRKIGLLFIIAVLAMTVGTVLACSKVQLDNKDKTYTVTYYYNYDGAPDNGVYRTDKVKQNTAAKKPTDPTRDKYDFSKWTTDTAGANEYAFAKTITGDLKLYAQWTEKPDGRILTDIEIAEQPTTKTYYVGETFDKTGMVVKAVYDNGDKEVITDYQVEYDFSEPNLAAVVNVKYQGKSKPVTVEVLAREVVSVAVSGTPSGTFKVGDAFDMAGLTFTATYNVGEPAAISTDLITFTSPALDADGKFTVSGNAVITFTYNGTITVTPTITVSVAPSEPLRTLDRIEITKEPTKKNYIEGENLNLDGIEVTAYYTDDTDEIIDIEDCNVTGYNSHTTGKQTVTVEYQGETDTFEVEVQAATLIGIEVTHMPTRTEYEVGDEFDRTGMIVTAKYENNISIPVTEYTVGGFDSSKEGTCTIVISYRGFNAEPFTVRVIQVKYTVKFITGVDGIAAPQQQTVNKNARAQKPNLAERKGYTFLGWFESDANDAFDFDTTPITGNITLTAKWNIIEYHITYIVDAALATAPANRTYTIEDDTITLPNPTNIKDGFNFIGWYTEVGTGEDDQKVYDEQHKVVTIEHGSIGDYTLYAYIDAKATYTFTFDYNYGNKTVDVKVMEGKTATRMNPDPTRIGYNFGGWYKEQDCTTEYKFDEPITADGTVVYAKWTAKTITVIFNADNGSDPTTEEVPFDQAVPEPSEPTKLGHTFLGWYRIDGTKWTFADKLCDKLEKEDLTLRAHWEAAEFDVVFNPDNGGQSTTVKVKFGAVIAAEKIPADPEKTGYRFDGWFTEEGEKWSSTQPLDAEGLNLTAHWTAKTYTVTFDTAGGTPAVTSQTVAFGEKVPAPTVTVTKYGYNLKGWFNGEDEWIFNQDTLQTEGLTLTAKWEAKDVTIKYVLHYVDANTVAYYTATVKFGGLITDKPSDPEEPGYDFLHWHMLDRETIWKFEEKLVEREGLITLEAHWNAKHYKITYVVDTGLADAVDEGEYIYNQEFTLPGVNVTEPGYTFIGWYNNRDYTGERISSIAAGTMGDQIFYAQITRNSTVKFIYNLNYEGAQNHEEYVVQGTRITSPYKPSRTGYTFISWYKEKECKNLFSFDQDIMQETTVFAKWDPITYTITFVLGNGEENQKRYFTSEQTVQAIEAPTWTGHKFIHWYVEDETIAYDGFGQKPTKDVTLYAKWELEEYTVKFNSMGGSGVDAIKVLYGNKITNKPNDPTLEGYTFMGWYREDFTSEWVFETDTVTGNITLYAKWVINKYTVHFDLNGGTGKADDQTVEHGKTASEPTGITWVGHTLKGWNLKNGTPWNFGDPVVREMWLTADWELNEYTVEFNANGGTAVAAQTVKHGEKIDASKVNTTRKDWTFVQWNDESGNKFELTTAITRNIKLSAQWESKVGTGTFLYYSQDGKTWTAGYTAVKNGDKNEWKVEGVTLSKGMQFIVVTYGSGGEETWYHAASNVTQHTFKNILTVGSKKDGDNYNFEVTAYNEMYTGAKWTLYIGDINDETKDCWGISFGVTIEYTKELRNPTDGNAATYTNENAATAEVYIRGSFTDEFGLFKEWSSGSTLLTVLKSGTEYTFRKVYLKKGDAFKIYVKGVQVGTDDKGWFGGELTGLNTVITLGNNGDEGNLYLGGIENGYYDIIFVNGATRTLKIVKWQAPTITTVKVTTQPSKTEYWRGETFSDAGMVVTVTDSDGKSYTVTDYTLDGTSTNSVGDKTITVSYGGKDTTFTIKVKDLTVTFDSDGGTSVDTQHPLYGEQANRPNNPTKTGHDFGGWYLVVNGVMQTTEYEFDTDVNEPIVLKAKWTVHEYTVKFIVDGVTKETLKVPYNTAIPSGKVPSATKTGYDFNGWKNGTTIFNLNTPVTSDLELIADYTIHSYTVILDYNYDGKTETQYINYNSTVSQPESNKVTRKGYTFLGWFKGDAVEKYVFSTPVTEDFTLTAKWEVIKYKITYVVDTALATAPTAPVEYTVETAVTLPDPTVTEGGYSFLGWYEDQEFSGSPITTIAKGSTGAKEFYARIEQNETVDLTFNFNYGETPETHVQKVVIGTAGKAYSPAPEREGYKFLGWFTDKDNFTEENKYTFPVMVEGCEVFAGWEINKYTVTFETFNGSDVDPYTEVEHGSTIEKPTDPTYEGYTFGGWYKDNGFRTPWNFETDTVTSDIELYAKWDIQKFTVTFKNGESVVKTQSDVTHGSKLEEPTLDAKTGYKLLGWFYMVEEQEKQWNFASDTVTSNVTLYTKYELITYIVTYYINDKVDNTAGNITSYDVTVQDDTLKVMSQIGYAFDGWHVGSMSGKKVTALIDAIPESGTAINLYAAWTLVEYTLAYDMGAYGETIASKTFTIQNLASTVATLPTKEQVTINATGRANGYYFTEWYCGDEKITSVTSDLLDGLNGTTLTVTAHYSNLYTVTFDPNGGTLATGTQATVQVEYGKPVAQPTKNPTLAGNDFVGWYLNGAKYSFATPVTGNITLVAQWTANPKNGWFMRYTTDNWQTVQAFAVTVGTNDYSRTVYIVDGITLDKNAIFYIAKYDAQGNGSSDIKPTNANLATYTSPSEISATTDLKFVAEKDDNGYMYKVSVLSANVADVKWTLEIETTQIYARPSDTPRYPDGTANTTGKWTADKGTVFIKGSFNGWNDSGAWSDVSTMMLTAVNGNKYYFTYVYLAKYDTFKVMKGSSWYGISSGSLNPTSSAVTVNISTSGSNITFMGTSGFYDLVVDLGGNKLTAVQHKEITVTSKKAKIVVGDKLTASDLTASDNSAINYVESKAATLGENTIKVVCGNTVVNFNYTAVALAVEKTELTTDPSKKTYNVGDAIVLTGAEVTLTYNNGKVEKTTDITYTCTGETSGKLLTAGTYTVKVLYNGNESGEYQITVNNVMTSLTAVAKSGETLEFVQDAAAPDLAKLIDVTANYNEGVEGATPVAPTAVTEFTLSAIDMTRLGEQEITVSYNGVTGKFKITIVAPSVTRLDVKHDGMPTYKIGQEITKTGITVTAYYNNDTNAVVTGYTIDVDNTRAGNATVTIGFGGQTAEFTITLGALTVTFNANGGTLTGSATVSVTTLGATVTQPTVSREHYTLGGWQYNGRAWDFGTGVTEDMELIATWTPVDYTITLVLGESAEYTATIDGETIVDMPYGSKFTLPQVTVTNLTDKLYIFLGWTLEINGDNTAYVTGQITVEGDITLYAHVAAVPTVELKFYRNDGTDTFSTLNVQMGKTPTPPQVSRDGYEFGGWFTNAECDGVEYTFAAAAEGMPTEFYAKWIPNKYTVSFNSNGGSDVAEITDVVYNTTISAPTAPTKAGYRFDGWYKDAALSNVWTFGENGDKVTDDITLYAKWTPNQYTVKFDSMGGSDVNDFTGDYNALVEEPNVPTKDGYTFGGWYKESSLTTPWDFDTDTMPIDGTTLYAKWNVITYTVEYYVDGSKDNSVGNITIFTIEYDGTQLKTPVKTGYLFDGWYTDGEYNGTKYTELKFKDLFEGMDSKVAIKLYGKFVKNTFNVTFVLGDGTAASGATYTFTDVENGDSVDVPKDPTPNNALYDFDGWYDAQTGGTKLTATSVTVNGADVTYYARYKAARVRIVLNASGWGGTGTTFDYHIHAWGGTGVGTVTGTGADDNRWSTRDILTSMGSGKYYFDISNAGITDIIFTHDEKGTRNEISRYQVKVSGLTLGATKEYTATLADITVDNYHKLTIDYGNGLTGYMFMYGIGGLYYFEIPEPTPGGPVNPSTVSKLTANEWGGIKVIFTAGVNSWTNQTDNLWWSYSSGSICRYKITKGSNTYELVTFNITSPNVSPSKTYK